jgi:hypothetical protein
MKPGSGFPMIYEVADLTHLDKPRRIGLIGLPIYNQRRKFLRQVASVGFYASIAPAIFESCTKEEEYLHFSVKQFLLPPWAMVSDSPAENNIIKIIFNKTLDITSLEECVALSPSADFSLDPFYKTDSDRIAGITDTISIHGTTGLLSKVYLKQGTTYTITIKGSIKSSDGELLDGNLDGTHGDDFVQEFTVPSDYNPQLLVTELALPDWPNVSVDQSDKNQLEVRFNQYIAADSVKGNVSFDPPVDFLAYPITETESDYYANRASGIVIYGKGGSFYRIFFTPGQSYTLIIKGGVKSIDGAYLDGNDNGSPGDDYKKTFNVPADYNASPRASIHDPYKTMDPGKPDKWVKKFEVYFDDVMDESSLRGAVTISPSINHELYFTTDTGAFSASHLMIIAGALSKDAPLAMVPGVKYTIKIAGTAKSVHNQYLDGDKNNIGGGDLIHNFDVPTDFNNPGCSIYTCSCEGNSCSCQSDCTCVGFDCSCQFEGCTLYGLR